MANSTEKVVEFVDENVRLFTDRVFYENIDEVEFEINEVTSPFILIQIGDTYEDGIAEVYPIILDIYGRDLTEIEKLVNDIRENFNWQMKRYPTVILRTGEGQRRNYPEGMYGVNRRQVMYDVRALH